RKGRVKKLTGGDIHRHVQPGLVETNGGSAMLPDDGLPACLVEHPISQRNDQSAFFRQRYELPWHQQPTDRVSPTDECLDANQCVVVELDDRLIVQFKLIAVE